MIARLGRDGEIEGFYMTERSPLYVLVPKPDTGASKLIWPGSGVVTAYLSKDIDVDVYYEGNLYRCPELRDWPARVACAARRLRERYPTVARGRFPASDFVLVAMFNDDGRIDVTDSPTLQGWNQPEDAGANP